MWRRVRVRARGARSAREIGRPGPMSCAGDDNAVDAGKVGYDRIDAQTVPTQDRRGSRPLAETDLGGEQAVRPQQWRQIGGDRALRTQPVGASV